MTPRHDDGDGHGQREDEADRKHRLGQRRDIVALAGHHGDADQFDAAVGYLRQVQHDAHRYTDNAEERRGKCTGQIHGCGKGAQPGNHFTPA